MTRKLVARLEERRLALKRELDAGKDSSERNRMGQFATPTGLAVDILRYAKRHLGDSHGVRFIDPALGTGSFYSALLDVFPQRRVSAAVGYEIDPHYGVPASKLWGTAGWVFAWRTSPEPKRRPGPDQFNLLICNPPYVRHHHIENGEKQRLKVQTQAACGVEIKGLAGLYCYFLALCHACLRKLTEKTGHRD